MKPEQIIQKLAAEISREIFNQNVTNRELLIIQYLRRQPLADLIRAAQEMFVAGGVETKASLNAHLKLRAALDKLAGE